MKLQAELLPLNSNYDFPPLTGDDQVEVIDVAPAPVFQKIAVAESGDEIAKTLTAKFNAAPVKLSDAQPGDKLDAIVLSTKSMSRQLAKAGAPNPPPSGKSNDPQITDADFDAALDRVKNDGTRLVLWPDNDVSADTFARALAARKIVTYNGMVGNLGAPWFGSWFFRAQARDARRPPLRLRRRLALRHQRIQRPLMAARQTGRHKHRGDAPRRPRHGSLHRLRRRPQHESRHLRLRDPLGQGPHRFLLPAATRPQPRHAARRLRHQRPGRVAPSRQRGAPAPGRNPYFIAAEHNSQRPPTRHFAHENRRALARPRRAHRRRQSPRATALHVVSQTRARVGSRVPARQRPPRRDGLRRRGR